MVVSLVLHQLSDLRDANRILKKVSERYSGLRYEKIEEIVKNLQRLVVRGPGGACYGVGMRPDVKQDLKKRKVDGAPKPGDVDFMKLGVVTGGGSIHDGDEVQEIRYDWCNWNSGE